VDIFKSGALTHKFHSKFLFLRSGRGVSG
jgi:hypothetical protein